MSTIKLREVNAIGATPKEFEIESPKTKYVEIKLTEDMWDEVEECYITRVDDLTNSFVKIKSDHIIEDSGVFMILSKCLNFIAVNIRDDRAKSVNISTFNGAFSEPDENNRLISFEFSAHIQLFKTIYIDSNGIVFNGYSSEEI